MRNHSFGPKSRISVGIVGLALTALLAAVISISLGSEEPPKIGKEGYIGTKACVDCHDNQQANFQKSTHGFKEDARSPAAQLGCETCHGPGKEHADGKGSIKNFGRKSTSPASDQNATCLTCHEKGKVALWNGSSHHERGIACTQCHSVHSGHDKNLAKRSKTEVCLQCHKSVRSDLQRFSHHPIREGKTACTDCHNPHGTVADKLIAANTINEKCFECHAEKRGPFLFDHAPTRESCLTCHKPHGSPNQKLLSQKLPLLCQNCHGSTQHPSAVYALRPDQFGQGSYSAQNIRVENRSCSNCHSQIHGSNHPSGKTFLR